MNRAARLVLAVALCGAGASDAATPYPQRQEVRQFIADMVERHGFVRRELRTLFAHARFQPAIVKAITPPTETRAKSWQAYRALFLTPERIEAGIEFRERHRDALARASARYGVTEEIITAIIGV